MFTPIKKVGTSFVPTKKVDESPEKEKLQWKTVIKHAVKNVPKSGAETLKSFAQPIVHPIETAKGLYKVGSGGVQKLIPGEQENEQEFDAAVGYYKERYGSLENFKKAISEDPVGVAVDIGSVMMPGGTAIKGAGTASKIGAITKAGQLIEKTGAMMSPITGASAASRKIVKTILPKGSAKRLYEGAAKFSTVLSESDRGKLVMTALNNNILPTYKGVKRVSEKIDKLNSQIEIMIDAAVTQGKKIPISRLFKDFRELNKNASLSGKPLDAQKAINNIRKQIYEANKQAGRTALNPQQAQQLKQQIYKDLSSYYSSISEAPVSIKAQKAIARAAKEAIEEIVPEVKKLNRTEGDLIALRDAIERSAARISNRDLMGLGVPMKGALGGVFGRYGVAAGLTLGILDAPQVKARLALVINNLKERGITVNPKLAAIQLGLIQTGSIAEEGVNNE